MAQQIDSAGFWKNGDLLLAVLRERGGRLFFLGVGGSAAERVTCGERFSQDRGSGMLRSDR